jgi:hypothetical protein
MIIETTDTRKNNQENLRNTATPPKVFRHFAPGKKKKETSCYINAI